jgi:hypothetical protein
MGILYKTLFVIVISFSHISPSASPPSTLLLTAKTQISCILSFAPTAYKEVVTYSDELSLRRPAESTHLAIMTTDKWCTTVRYRYGILKPRGCTLPTA